MTDTGDMPEQVRAATELLEAVTRDPFVLEKLSEDERVRLLQAVAEVACPDPEERRQQHRARRRRERSQKIQRDEDVLAGTGIRRLRSEPVFTTPNVFAPEAFVQEDISVQQDINGDGEFRDLWDPQHCYVCKEKSSHVHHIYDQLCLPCAEFNFAKRTERADLRG
ncbi:MAG: oxidoreductase, partial [Acidimicrobiia bacterium]